jgi:hypothetical protein
MSTTYREKEGQDLRTGFLHQRGIPDFYAFDLDAQPGVQNARSLQAWGRKGPDKEQARNLGIFYEDNASKKRWVLKADDPKSPEDIDAVFVTVEPHGGSQHPSGKQLIFTSLRIIPNHP